MHPTITPIPPFFKGGQGGSKRDKGFFLLKSWRSPIRSINIKKAIFNPKQLTLTIEAANLMLSTLLDRIGDYNPQLFRELKGRFKPRNLAIVAGISALGQILLYLYYKNQIPLYEYTDRYCNNDSAPPIDEFKGFTLDLTCEHDKLGQVLESSINFDLWHLDIFVSFSVIGFLVLISLGTYLLIDDLAKEEQRGTLNFVRLSPQSSVSVLLGKLLGVPSLLYLGCILALPFHLQEGLTAHIPLPLILSYYALALVSCTFFYSAALLFSLATAKFGSLQVWIGSAFLCSFLFFITYLFFNSYKDIVSFSPFDWVTIFYPIHFLAYLVAKAPLSLDRIDYLNVKDLAKMNWFYWPLWEQPINAFGFAMSNYGLGLYWIWHGLKRRFSNPQATLISKQQSYWFSGTFTVLVVGFAVQLRDGDAYYTHFQMNFGMLLFGLCIFFACLIIALSPHRPTLQDWSRYRHQNQGKIKLIKDLIWGDKSPANLAIALNLITVSSIIIAAIFFIPNNVHYLQIMAVTIITSGTILIYASIAQWMLLMPLPKREIWTVGTLAALLILPLFTLALFGINPSEYPQIFLFSGLPMLAIEHISPMMALSTIIGQGIAIALTNMLMVRQLKNLGESQTKALLAGRNLHRDLKSV